MFQVEALYTHQHDELPLKRSIFLQHKIKSDLLKIKRSSEDAKANLGSLNAQIQRRDTKGSKN